MARLNWQRLLVLWLHGLLKALLMGAAASVTTVLATVIDDPEMMSGSVRPLIRRALYAAVFGVFTHGATYLAQSPLPAPPWAPKPPKERT